MGIKAFDKNKKDSKTTKTKKMKFAFSLLALAAAQDNSTNDNVPDDEWQGAGTGNAVAGPRSGAGAAEDADRRYDDLEQIANEYWRKQGMTGKNAFDDRKYWAYGCHCFLLGDRPMSEMGKGKPVDALDNKCKAYKDCQKCVREKHGDQCIGEFVRYTWRYATKRSQFESADEAGSCERELFECDLQLVKDTFAQKDVFNKDYHGFWSTIGFDHEDDSSCPSGGSSPVEHQCCGGVDAPWYWIGLNNNKCCNQSENSSGVVVGINDQC